MLGTCLLSTGPFGSGPKLWPCKNIRAQNLSFFEKNKQHKHMFYIGCACESKLKHPDAELDVVLPVSI